MAKFKIACLAFGYGVLHEMDSILTDVRLGMEDGRVLTEDEALSYMQLLEEKGLGTPCPEPVHRSMAVEESNGEHLVKAGWPEAVVARGSAKVVTAFLCKNATDVFIRHPGEGAPVSRVKPDRLSEGMLE